MTEHRNSAHYAALMHLRPGDVVFDVGANRGDVSYHLAGVAGRVFAFEPNPFIEMWDLPANVTVIRKALSDRVGTATFYRDTREQALASSLMVLNGMESFVETMTVETNTLDSFCATAGVVPDIVKIDVEGFEPQVVEGARKTIIARKPLIIFELWESHWRRIHPMVAFLSQYYHLAKLSDGRPAIPYYSEPRNGVDDIICIPL